MKPFLIVAAGVALALTILSWDSIGMDHGPSCSVGTQGTAMTVEVRGWSAERGCDALEQVTPNSYRYYGPPVLTPVVCQFDIRGLRLTVHDEGALKLVGNAACITLRAARDEAAASPPQQSVPTPMHTSGAEFASCQVTRSSDRLGNLIWNCPSKPYGYAHWTPPADGQGDWTAFVGMEYALPGTGPCVIAMLDAAHHFAYSCAGVPNAVCYPPADRDMDHWSCQNN